MIGLVLCGGKSSRMGQDKGMLLMNQQSWAATIGTLLHAIDLPVYYSVNNVQEQAYSQLLPAEQLIKDNDSLNIYGPSIGLFSAHLQYPQEDILVVACDMPFMQKEVLQQLLQYREENKDYDAWLFTNHEEPEPLCAVYSAVALKKLLEKHRTEGFKKHSMKYLLEQINPCYISIPPAFEKSFSNLNSHADLNGL